MIKEIKIEGIAKIEEEGVSSLTKVFGLDSLAMAKRLAKCTISIIRNTSKHGGNMGMGIVDSLEAKEIEMTDILMFASLEVIGSMKQAHDLKEMFGKAFS